MYNNTFYSGRKVDKVKEFNLHDDVVVTNTRHFEALSAAFEAVSQVEIGLRNELPGDLVAIDLRQALHYLGTLTGEITTNEILGSIFSKFCIGK